MLLSNISAAVYLILESNLKDKDIKVDGGEDKRSMLLHIELF